MQVGLPRGIGGHRGPAFGAIGEVLIRPDVYDFVHIAHFSREVTDQMTEMLHLHRQTFLFIECEEVAQPSGLQFVGAMVDDHDVSSNYRGDCVTWSRPSQPLWTQALNQRITAA